MSVSTPALNVVPLGGLGEVGMNCLALVWQGQALLIDCGVNFAEDDLGVDVIHPDFDWLENSGVTLLGTFITHGHEDHIGAVPFLLRRFPTPLWAPQHALLLIEHRLKERGVSGAQLHRAEAGSSYTIGPFQVEPVRVSHSIAEASALHITTPGGVVVHSGDFKFDPAPSDGEVTDEERLRAIGDAGVDLLLSDSTNVDRRGDSGSEGQVAEALSELIGRLEQRVVVALFSSNVQRLISLGQIAERCGRRICLLGRSLQLHVEVALRTGRLDWPRSQLVAADRVSEVPRGELMVLASGTQAEPGAALTRLAAREHQQLQLEAGDAVVMSSRIIPGNDRKVVRMMGGLLRQGVRVHSTFSDPGIHASGHAAREEQQRMLELIRPRTFLPVHGTRHHLTRHAELARSLGVEQVQVVENGQSVRLDDDGLHLGPVVHSGRVSVGFGGSELPPNTLAERGDIARNGVAVFAIVLDGRGAPRGEPRLSLLGVPGMAAPGACDALARRIGDGLGEQLARWHKRGLDKQQELARLVRRHIERRTGTRPRVEVQLLEP